MQLLKAITLVAVAAILTAAKPLKQNSHMQAKGTFEVKISPAEGTALEKEAGVGRMTIDKNWSGDLEGTSKGAMLTSATESTGAMAYVAMEKVTGKINGRAGTFCFAHTATMIKGNAGSSILKIVVVAGSGTEGLAGLSGELSIKIDAEGKHSHIFNYDLP